MNIIKTFFENLDFSFEQDFVQKDDIEFLNNKVLTEKIKNNIYFYKAPENVNTSFYIFDLIDLNENELYELRKYIWNEDKCEFYFYLDSKKTISLYYAKFNPQKKHSKSKIGSFKGQDDKEIEKIKKWNFETGTFWLNYKEFIKKIADNERVDTLLINRLIDLKKELLSALGKDKEEQVQSLIDRTLFIKFLEDNHIINSFFYEHYFGDKSITYKKLLEEKPDFQKINLLFELINKIFDNVLFKTPYIEEQYIIKASPHIYNTISGEIKGQLSLFDFQFNVIPIEFISHIYEVFLEDKQLNEGIYYTPPKLAQLIIDDTITKQGKVLDPACGSGMFLILSFRKMLNALSINDKNVSENIKIRLKLLKENIFGIEKQYTAWRLSIFALYLEIFNGLKPTDIKEFITQKIKSGNIKIFDDFSTNIINGNSLEVEKNKKHFENKTFDYIIGNPPFLQVSKDDEEIDFFNKYKPIINGKEISAKEIIGKNQISQAFMLKIKDWANNNTNFGFVLNSSNFYNEGKSVNFQKFFFENYQIKNFYELSKVKEILFKKAKESVVVVIFSNKQVDDNIINYYPVNLELFSQIFKILVIKEDNKIELPQKSLLNSELKLRELLIGNEFDLELINKLSNQQKLEKFLLKNKLYNSLQGLTRHQSKHIATFFNIPYEKDFKNLSRKEKNNYYKLYDTKHYIKETINENFKIPYIYDYSLINEFIISKFDGYTEFNLINKNNFQRPRNTFIFQNENILFCRVGKRIKAVFCAYDKVFSVNVFGIKLESKRYYYLFTALLNSNIINYFINIRLKKRPSDNLPRIDKNGVKQIPIPSKFDDDLFNEISKLSQQLTDGKIKYENEIKDKLNELIYDLYDLNYLERQRIKDFFAPKRRIEKNDIEKYKESLLYTLEMYFEDKPNIDYSIDLKFGFDMLVVGIFFNNTEKMPTSEKMLRYKINELMQKTNNSLFAMREFLFGKDCIYIIKNRQLKNWTETKAYEDGKLILKNLS